MFPLNCVDLTGMLINSYQAHASSKMHQNVVDASTSVIHASWHFLLSCVCCVCLAT